MKFGKKAGTINSGGGGGNVDWPKGLKSGETRTRFVSEIADWQEYWEHYDEDVKFFPCTGDKRTCPGCTSNNERTAKASKRYLTPALDPSTGKVYGLKIGQDLANRLSLRNDRNGGTITNRDYTLIRTGQGLDTEYDVEQEEKVAIDLSAYTDVIDLEEMLSAQFSSAWPDFDPDNPPQASNGRRSRANDDDDTPAPARKRAAKKAAPAAPAKGTKELIEDSAAGTVVTDDDPPPWEKAEREQASASGLDEFAPKAEEPAAEIVAEPAAEVAVEDDDGETVEITEDDLKAMGRTDLMKLARQAELKVTLTMSREDIIAAFLKEFAV